MRVVRGKWELGLACFRAGKYYYYCGFTKKKQLKNANGFRFEQDNTNEYEIASKSEFKTIQNRQKQQFKTLQNRRPACRCQRQETDT